MWLVLRNARIIRFRCGLQKLISQSFTAPPACVATPGPSSCAMLPCGLPRK